MNVLQSYDFLDFPSTLLRRGFLRFAFALARREEAAKIAPAASILTPDRRAIDA